MGPAASAKVAPSARHKGFGRIASGRVARPERPSRASAPRRPGRERSGKVSNEDEKGCQRAAEQLGVKGLGAVALPVRGH